MSAKIITIFSNKGGVGKTFVSVNLATSLAVNGNKVLILDLDLQGAQDMARMLNLSPRTTLADLTSNPDQTEDPLFIERAAVRHSSGLSFLAGVKNTKQISLISPDTVKHFLKKAAQVYDYIIVDAGKSFNETLVTVFDNSNFILLVATPDILAVYQIKWCVEVLQNLQFPLKMVQMVLNRSESRGSVAWQEVRSALPCEIFGHVPSDGKAVGLALNRGIPVVIDSPKSKVAEAFTKMTQTLKNQAIFVQTGDVERQRGAGEGIEKPDAFWEKFGITQQMSAGMTDQYTNEEDEIVSLKKKIHEKLVERLNLDGITTDSLSNTQQVLKVKKTAEEVVSNLLLEESGGKLASLDERVRLSKEIVNEALGLGPLEELLADPDISDIMCNNKDEIYIEKNGKIVLTNKKFISDDRMRSIIDRIIAPLGRRIDESNPMVDARLPDGSRINAIIPPLSLGGPMITIRKFGTERIEVTDLLDKFHSLNRNIATFLKACVVGRKNIIVSGGTGAGKTTLLNVLSEFIPDGERIITIEDAAELKLKKTHWARLESRPRNIEGKGQVTIRDLFVNCLRMRPDRIVVGECRGPEVLDMLQAMNTGHDGSLTTLHANSARDVLIRMHSMMLLSGIDLPVRAINEMISSAIQIIVHINRYSDGGRRITGVVETAGLDDDYQLVLNDVFRFNQQGIDENGKVLGNFEATGHVPKCFKEFKMRGLDIDESIFKAGPAS